MELDMLSNCVGQGERYTFSPHPETDTRLIRTIDELYADVALSACHLPGKLKAGTSTANELRWSASRRCGPAERGSQRHSAPALAAPPSWSPA